MVQDIKAKVLYNNKVSKSYFRMGIKAGWGKFDPGQFVMVRVPNNVVFLRRPFSISRRIDSDSIELFYKVVGPGTTRLSDITPGEYIQVLGPLGNGFSVPKSLKRVILVAGGYGVAPFIGLTEQLSKTKTSMELYYGGKGLEDIQFLDEFRERGVNLHISTEDGSLGTKGMITELLFPSSASTQHQILDSVIYSCGPQGMTDEVVRMAKKHSIPAQVSYETYMGCGIGVCLGCVVKTKEGYKRACKDGPVFNVDEIV